ncbi:MAG: hypothetical protein ACRD3K_01230 [Edaphobacter sp.]
MKRTYKFVCLGLTAVLAGVGLHATAASKASWEASQFLTPNPKPAQRFGNVFSIAHSIKGDGFDEIVRRNGGTAEYAMVKVTADKLTFSVNGRYDGQPPDVGVVNEMSDGGKMNCWAGQCRTYTDASGLLYNEFLWGKTPRKIAPGTTWSVDIGQAWEMGPAAKQQITVVAVDPVAHAATLLREGHGDGAYANEPKQIHIKHDGKTYLVDLIPGEAHWKGYTTFRAGFVQSDELVMERTVTLRSAELGELKASERFLMLLNATPEES